MMVSSTDTQTGSDSGTINGIDVGLTAELPTFATDQFEVTADITTGSSTQDINVALVIDTSGSTAQNSGSDVDGDGINDTFLAAQKLAAKEVFESLKNAGYDPAAVTITLIEYNGNGSTVGNFDLNDETAFESAVDGLTAGGSTNFDDALDEVISEWQATTTDGTADDNPESEVTANDSNLVLFLSDGRPTSGGTNFTGEIATLENDFDADITAIGIGANSSLTQLNAIDNTGGATQITDLTQLGDLITAPPPLPELIEVQIVVTDEDGIETITTIPAGDPRIIETPLGLRIDCEPISGYDYEVGESLSVEVRAVFTPNGDTLVVDGFALPMFVCFVRGTHILTPSGEKRIEDLAIGDRVVTRDHGVQPIRWIGCTRLPASALAARPELRPVRISAGALGPDIPVRDLCVSRQHRVLVRDWRAEMMFGSAEGVLTPAFTLINDTSVRPDCDLPDGVDYFHIAFDSHEVIYSEGLETESFHPAADTVSVLTEPQRQELYAIFPELEEGLETMSAARVGLKGRDGHALNTRTIRMNTVE
ncbi:Hint domain-containing protein [Hasllibacter sp. MH4015]|uniref:Hint domain-containing protein n=1 Tax=Hasllibacter sp. MH4015 TaxID=2854029 RepID=UPI001CD516DB|nr:Hint domain-containing protein [Hasllibacter sp. MH4015]